MTMNSLNYIHSIQAIIDADRDREAGEAGEDKGNYSYVPSPRFFTNLEPAT